MDQRKERQVDAIIPALPGWCVLEPWTEGGGVAGFERSAIIAWYVDGVVHARASDGGSIDPSLHAVPIVAQIGGPTVGYAIEEPLGRVIFGDSSWRSADDWLETIRGTPVRELK